MIYDTSNQLEKNKLLARVDYLIENKKIVEVKAKNKNRTVTQNAYLHVLFNLYAIAFGYTSNESKTHMKRSCEFMIYEKKGEKFVKDTSSLDTKGLTDFIEWIRNYSSLNGHYLPTPDEYRLNRYMIDNEITLHKQYL